MAELAEIVRENVGKDSYQMRTFFQKMINQEELKAYSVEVDKGTVERGNKDEKVVRVKKGAILKPVKALREYQPVFIEDPKTGGMYNLDIGSRGGMFSNDGDSQTIYHHCVLERLAKRDDIRKVSKREGLEVGSILIPQDLVTARLSVSYDEDWESGGGSEHVVETRRNLIVDGEKDVLFKKVCQFVKRR